MRLASLAATLLAASAAHAVPVDIEGGLGAVTSNATSPIVSLTVGFRVHPYLVLGVRALDALGPRNLSPYLSGVGGWLLAPELRLDTGNRFSLARTGPGSASGSPHSTAFALLLVMRGTIR